VGKRQKVVPGYPFVWLPGGPGGLTGRSRIFEDRISNIRLFDTRLSLAVEVLAIQGV
jgi:hypothetical protein